MTLQERLNLRMSLMGYDPVINLSESEEIETVSEEVTESYNGKVPFWKKSEISEEHKKAGYLAALVSPALAGAYQSKKREAAQQELDRKSGKQNLYKSDKTGRHIAHALVGAIPGIGQVAALRQANKRYKTSAKLEKNENINTTDILEKDFNTVGKVNIKKGKYRIL